MTIEKEIYIGIDNGVTGSIGIITISGATKSSAFIKTPTMKCLSYTKEEQHIQRIDWRELLANLPHRSTALIERPMVNPKAFKATQSALRSLEATIMVLEMLDIEYLYVDSKTWQREFFSSSIIGHDDLKKASKEIALKLFPSNGNFITKHGDGDGLLIAEYLYRQQCS